MLDSFKREVYEKIDQKLSSVNSKSQHHSSPTPTTNTEGRINFASESLGAEIVSINATTLCDSNIWNQFLSCTWIENPVRNLIKSTSIEAGECFGIKGSTAGITIKLMGKIKIDEVVIGHITSKMTPYKRIDTAPKEFSVWVMESIDGEKYYCGSFEYNINTDEVYQHFDIDHENCSRGYFEFVHFDFESNHGNEDTCIYR